MKSKHYQETSHRTESTLQHFPTDILLRRYGYRIHKRPKRGEPLWERDGRIEAQSHILKRIATLG